MIEEEPLCPECGYPLTGIRVLKDKERKITIEFSCDGAGQDIFHFQIKTGISDKDIKKLKEEGKAIPREMSVRLVERKSEKQVIKEYDEGAKSQ